MRSVRRGEDQAGCGGQGECRCESRESTEITIFKQSWLHSVQGSEQNENLGLLFKKQEKVPLEILKYKAFTFKTTLLHK